MFLMISPKERRPSTDQTLATTNLVRPALASMTTNKMPGNQRRDSAVSTPSPLHAGRTPPPALETFKGLCTTLQGDFEASLLRIACCGYRLVGTLQLAGPVSSTSTSTSRDSHVWGPAHLQHLSWVSSSEDGSNFYDSGGKCTYQLHSHASPRDASPRYCSREMETTLKQSKYGLFGKQLANGRRKTRRAAAPTVIGHGSRCWRFGQCVQSRACDACVCLGVLRDSHKTFESFGL